MKTKNKIVTTIKMLILGAILKSKIDIGLKLFSAVVQTKIFFVLLSILMLQKFKLFLDLKATPKKEIHYEQTQHDHHYDNDIWGLKQDRGLWI